MKLTITHPPRYGLSADELHEAIVNDLADLCEHMGWYDVKARWLDTHEKRPLEQTIRGVVHAVHAKRPYGWK